MEYYEDFNSDYQSRYSISANAIAPQMYEVFLIKDEQTPDEFISYIIADLFHKDAARAEKMANIASKKSRVSCGLFTKDVAETKQSYVMERACDNSYPLVCVVKEGKGNAIKKS